jgi:multidrug efflux pump subunit AcrA (membrane-fusion protein)
MNEKEVVYKIYLLVLLQGVIYAAIPLSLQGIITYTMAGRFSASLILLCAVTIVATLFIGLLQLAQMRINETLQESIFGKLTARISAYLNVPESKNISSKIAHFFEVVTLQKGITKILLELSLSIISIIFGLLILPIYSSWFVLFTILLSIAFYFVVTYYGGKAIESNKRTSKQKYRIFDWFKKLSENPDLLGKEEEKSDDLLNEYLINRKEYYNTIESQYIGILIFKLLFITILLFVGVYLVQIGELNIGQFVSSEIIILLVINAVEKLVGSLETCYDIIIGLYKIEDIFSETPEYSFLNNNNELQLKSFSGIYTHPYSKKLQWVFYSLIAGAVIILFMPWTQSIDAQGSVAALNPTNQPQNITSRIAGRIEKWYIQDGAFVKKNDTIAFISEIKDEYIDPRLIERSESQIASKETVLESYEKKVNAINLQIDALNNSLRLKTKQIKNKILQSKTKLSSDSVEVITAKNNYQVSQKQLERYEELLAKGVISKTDLENRKIKQQEALSKMISAENKYIAAQNEFINTEMELSAAQQEYTEKLMKAESDKFSVLSMLYDTEGALTKMQNQLTNYSMRKSYYYVLAPQNGYINKMSVQGIGEIIKEGGVLGQITPVSGEQAVELYINPIDMPLVKIGQRVQLVFDGWPAFIFSGWPGVSFGTYSAEIVSYDRTISDNGKYRVLAVNKGEKWPKEIQIGGGVKGFALLNNVVLIYELWRKANGFPPEFYSNKSQQINDTDAKK